MGFLTVDSSSVKMAYPALIVIATYFVQAAAFVRAPRRGAAAYRSTLSSGHAPSSPRTASLLSSRSSTTSIMAAIAASAHQNTDDYLNSLSFFSVDSANGGNSATDAYLNSLSHAAADVSSFPFSATTYSASPEEYLTALSSTFVVVVADNDNGVSPPGLLLASDDDITTTTSSPATDDVVLGAVGITDDPTAAAAATEPATSSTTAFSGMDLDDLSSQLSELSKSYSSLAADKNDASYAEKVGRTSSDLTDLAAGLSDKLSSVADESKKLFGNVGTSLQTGFSGKISSGITSALDQAGATVQKAQQAVGEGTIGFVESSRSAIYGRANQGFIQGIDDAERGQKIVEGSIAPTTAIKQMTDASISDLANSVLAGLRAVGGVLLRILDTFLDIFAGTSIAAVVATAQAAAQGVTSGAIDTVNKSVISFGDITLRDIAQALVTLLALVVKVLFSILSAVVKVASGKGIDDWALAANGAVEQETAKLMAQANTVAYDVTHKSFAELGDAVGHFSLQAGRLMVESIALLGDALTVSPIVS